MADMPPVSRLLGTLIGTAREAGEVLLDYFNRPRADIGVSAKKRGDFVSDADRAAETLIDRRLSAEFPSFSHIREESGKQAGQDPSSVLIYDPLDGTKNFLVGTPLWSVSIALEQNAEIVACVTHAPRVGETFFAEKGRGAWLINEFRGVAEYRKLSAHPGETAENGVIDTYPQSRFVGNAAEHYRQTGTEIRTIGTTCLDLAYVAAGRYSAFVKEANLGPWDFAAGALLIREAGGVVTDIDGNPDFIYGKTVIAANPRVHERILERVRSGATNVFAP